MITPQWPADHEEKHREAALKGWEGRRSPMARRHIAKRAPKEEAWNAKWRAAYEDDTPLEPLMTRWKKPVRKLTDRELFVEANEDLNHAFSRHAGVRFKSIQKEIDRRREKFMRE